MSNWMNAIKLKLDTAKAISKFEALAGRVEEQREQGVEDAARIASAPLLTLGERLPHNDAQVLDAYKVTMSAEQWQDMLATGQALDSAMRWLKRDKLSEECEGAAEQFNALREQYASTCEAFTARDVALLMQAACASE